MRYQLDQTVLRVDLHDVLMNLVPRWLDRINSQWGSTLELENIRSWNMEPFLPEASLKRNRFRSILRQCSLYRDAEPIEGAARAIERLSQKFEQVVVVTAAEHCMETQKRWIKKVLPSVSAVVFTDRKSLVLPNTHLIDDGLHNSPTILFDRPWNRDAECTMDFAMNAPHCYRAKDWYEASKLLGA